MRRGHGLAQGAPVSLVPGRAALNPSSPAGHGGGCAGHPAGSLGAGGCRAGKLSAAELQTGSGNLAATGIPPLRRPQEVVGSKTDSLIFIRKLGGTRKEVLWGQNPVFLSRLGGSFRYHTLHSTARARVFPRNVTVGLGVGCWPAGEGRKDGIELPTPPPAVAWTTCPKPAAGN